MPAVWSVASVTTHCASEVGCGYGERICVSAVVERDIVSYVLHTGVWVSWSSPAVRPDTPSPLTMLLLSCQNSHTPSGLLLSLMACNKSL